LAEHSYVFRDIAMVFTAALVLWIPGLAVEAADFARYVLAGLLLSPLTPGPRVHDTQNFEVMAEIA